MPTDAKREAVRELAELIRGSSAIAVADYRGLKVSEMQTVRRSLRANGVALTIAKNRRWCRAPARRSVPNPPSFQPEPLPIRVTSARFLTALAAGVVG